MSEHKTQQNQEITNVQAEITDQAPDPRDAGRRQFINQALAVSAGAALSGFFPHLKAAPLQGAGAKCAPIFGKELVNPGEIPSGPDGILHAVLRVHGEDRLISYLDVNGTNPQVPPSL